MRCAAWLALFVATAGAAACGLDLQGADADDAGVDSAPGDGGASDEQPPARPVGRSCAGFTTTAKYSACYDFDESLALPADTPPLAFEGAVAIDGSDASAPSLLLSRTKAATTVTNFAAIIKRFAFVGPPPAGSPPMRLVLSFDLRIDALKFVAASDAQDPYVTLASVILTKSQSLAVVLRPKNKASDPTPTANLTLFDDNAHKVIASTALDRTPAIGAWTQVELTVLFTPTAVAHVTFDGVTTAIPLSFLLEKPAESDPWLFALGHSAAPPQEPAAVAYDGVRIEVFRD
jgi:hypothetical protein